MLASRLLGDFSPSATARNDIADFDRQNLLGGANIYRVVPGQGPEVYAEDFTNVIDIVFGDDGSLYVLEITTNSLLSGDPTGALIRVNPDGTRDTLVSEGLVFPTGVSIGPDSALYVSNFGVFAGAGQVVRIEP